MTGPWLIILKSTSRSHCSSRYPWNRSTCLSATTLACHQWVNNLMMLGVVTIKHMLADEHFIDAIAACWESIFCVAGIANAQHANSSTSQHIMCTCVGEAVLLQAGLVWFLLCQRRSIDRWSAKVHAMASVLTAFPQSLYYLLSYMCVPLIELTI